MERIHTFPTQTLCVAIAAFILSTSALVGQNTKDKDETPAKAVKVSGYVQADYQYGDKDASLQVGEPNKDKTEGFGRFGIRRGRLKTTVTTGPVDFVGTLNINEKAVTPFNLYIRHTHKASGPRALAYSLALGLQEVPFGYEITESSSARLAPERAEYLRYLFPGDIDIALNAKLHKEFDAGERRIMFLTNAALLSGNGANSMRKSIPDGLVRIELKTSDLQHALNWSFGGSAYLGYVTAGEKGRERKSRQYFDAFAQLRYNSSIGATALRAELVGGKQPGQLDRMSVTGAGTSADEQYAQPILIRHFLGWMAQIDHRIGLPKHLSITPFVKYAYFDRNTKLSGESLAHAIESKTASDAYDTSSSTIGAGLRCDWDRWSLTSYYEWANNEKVNLAESPYAADRQDNRFTLRLQYVF